MRKEHVEAVVRALNESAVRYLIAGGLAVMAHGYPRVTADIDVIIDLDDPKLPQALAGLRALGYRPRPPVPIEQFADAGIRRNWIQEKGLTVFSLYSSNLPDTEVDLFTEPPFDFHEAYDGALRLNVAPNVSATFVGYDDLVAMKRRSGRPQDLADVEQLKSIKGELERG